MWMFLKTIYTPSISPSSCYGSVSAQFLHIILYFHAKAPCSTKLFRELGDELLCKRWNRPLFSFSLHLQCWKAILPHLSDLHIWTSLWLSLNHLKPNICGSIGACLHQQYFIFYNLASEQRGDCSSELFLFRSVLSGQHLIHHSKYARHLPFDCEQYLSGIVHLQFSYAGEYL